MQANRRKSTSAIQHHGTPRCRHKRLSLPLHNLCMLNGYMYVSTPNFHVTLAITHAIRTAFSTIFEEITNQKRTLLRQVSPRDGDARVPLTCSSALCKVGVHVRAERKGQRYVNQVRFARNCFQSDDRSFSLKRKGNHRDTEMLSEFAVGIRNQM